MHSSDEPHLVMAENPFYTRSDFFTNTTFLHACSRETLVASFVLPSILSSFSIGVTLASQGYDTFLLLSSEIVHDGYKRFKCLRSVLMDPFSPGPRF